jgi:16S rRNA U1498 N3-methylase RsmE
MEYVTLEQAKDHLNLIDFDDDDVYIEDLIDVSEAAVLNEIRAQQTALPLLPAQVHLLQTTRQGTSLSYTVKRSVPLQLL